MPSQRDTPGHTTKEKLKWSVCMCKADDKQQPVGHSPAH